MFYVGIIKMPKGYYVKKTYGAHIQMKFVKTENEANDLYKKWNDELNKLYKKVGV